MSEQRPYPSQEKQSGQTRWFSFLYRTRVMVHQGDIPIVNLSLAFALLVAVSAPWVAVAGLAVALALGYRIHVERNAPGFSGDFQQVVHDAAEHVKAFLSVEMSKGQMVDDVRLAVNGKCPVSFFGRTGGVIPTPAEILHEIETITGGAK